MTDNRNEAQQETQQQAQDGGRSAGADARSENLLPAGQGGQDPQDQQDDGRFEVAEEVNLDEQSDASRRVGKLPAGSTSDALAEVFKDDGATS